MMNDPVEEFLSTDFNSPAAPGLASAVLAKTMSMLRRRRRARRLAWAGSLAACFLAGMATMSVWRAFEAGERRAQSPPPQKDLVAQQADQSAIPPTQPEAPPTLLELEWRAFDSRDNRAALFYEVAQRYLEEQKDYDSALRCYRQALDAVPSKELAIRPDDNWLVMALKEARQKENNDAVINP